MLFRNCIYAFVGLVFGIGPAFAQNNGWGDLDGLLWQSLAPGRTGEASYWLPDNADPAVATVALGITYSHGIEASGSIGIDLGLFRPEAGNWALFQPVGDVFGFEPRDAVFFADRIEISTSTLGPNDARCCPTAVTRWSIDRATGAVSKVQ